MSQIVSDVGEHCVFNAQRAAAFLADSGYPEPDPSGLHQSLMRYSPGARPGEMTPDASGEWVRVRDYVRGVHIAISEGGPYKTAVEWLGRRVQHSKEIVVLQPHPTGVVLTRQCELPPLFVADGYTLVDLLLMDRRRELSKRRSLPAEMQEAYRRLQGPGWAG